MTTALVQKLTGVRDLSRILETTVKELSDSLAADSCQVMLTNPLNPNVTSIFEYRTNPEIEQPPTQLTLPLVVRGRSFGSFSIAREAELLEDEVNLLRITLSELGDIIRYAQINDIVQRGTFRETFLIEIGNLMSYSLGIGDALFMVVNILGKVLQVSRCLFVCTDDAQAGWKCYEFWQQDKVVSCQEYRWPTADSNIVAQTLLHSAPLILTEGQENSYVSPVQEELQFIGVRSQLGLALSSNEAVQGLVILQQCDYRREWTRDEIDMVQKVADRVGEALFKLPAEKRLREPIMQLHQRIVPQAEHSETSGKASMGSVRTALKGALGQQAIPIAGKAATVAVKAPTIATTPIGSSFSAQAEPALQSQSAPQVSAVQAKEAGDSGRQTFEKLAALPKPPQIAEVTQSEGEDGSVVWGNLDAIPTPPAGAARAGLSGAIWPKAKHLPSSLSSPKSPLLATLSSSKHKAVGSEDESHKFVEGPPLDIDEAKARARLDKILSSASPLSDYVFATPGLDARMLGRIDGWLSQIEAKDKYKNGHARQVAEYAVAIARLVHLSAEEIVIIRQAALVHDVGKLGSAAQILQKRDEELTDPELIMVMKHPLDGAELLESFPDLGYLTPIVRAHHEEFDGNGYPQGLKGEEIPLAARIIYIANSYFSMISSMCYGRGISPEEAQKQLLAGSGKQYDPDLVSAFTDYLIANRDAIII
jgi:HD-GYP domain-containing protein (c-di-GMP phosphodiesterase class II)